MSEIVKILITILITPYIIIILIWSIFIGVYETLWESKKRKTNSERQN